jgi:arsenate reductase
MKVLFMCTANSCRSVLSEGLFSHLAPEGITAVSSGSFPGGRLNPRAVSTLQGLGVDTANLYSKGSEVFSEAPPDVVITVCDKAGGEPCPVFFGSAVKSHWGLADPSEAKGTDSEVQAAFDATVARIRKRIEAFLSLDHALLTAAQLKRELDRIGDLG